ncbi:MAG TPA: hypothetical protein VG965_06555 [Patescibacteria group bacterium]|nr:hypothetical protein [Patescibacteria group bacterium]
MDIQRVSDTSFKIKGKNASFVFNPDKKIDEEIIILTKKASDFSQYAGKIVIDSPGEYEAAGMSIKGDGNDKGIVYTLIEENQKAVVLSSPSVFDSGDVEDAGCVVTFLDPEKPEDLSKITADVLAVVGPESSLPSDKSNVRKADKISLKKTDEYKGSIIHLSK